MTLTDELTPPVEEEPQGTAPPEEMPEVQTPEAPETPEPSAEPGYTPDARAKWEGMSEQERWAAFESSQRAIGQYDEDRAVGKLYREGRLQSAAAPEQPKEDPATLRQQQAEAVIEQIATSEDMLAQLADEGFEGEQLQTVAKSRAKAQYNLLAPIIAQNQQLAGIVNNLLSGQALTRDIQRFIPQGLNVTEAEAVEELQNMVGGQVNYTDWSAMPAGMQGLMGELAAYRAAAKPKKASEPEPTPKPRVVQPGTVFNVKQTGSGNVKPTAQDPRVAAEITRLQQGGLGNQLTAEDIEELAIDNVAYRDRTGL